MGLLPLLVLARSAGAWSTTTPSAGSALTAPTGVTADIAKAAIQQMYTEVALFVSLSLAICGGMLLLMLQVLTHNHDHAKQRISLRWPWLLASAFVLEALSASFGLFCIAAITDAVPAIFYAPFNANTTIYNTRFAGDQQITVTGGIQVLLFILSLLSMIVFIVINVDQISARRSRTV